MLGFPHCRLTPSGGVWASAAQCRGCSQRDPFAWWPGADPRPPGKRVLIRAGIDSYTGYGQIAEGLGRALAARGATVAFVPIRQCERFLPLADSVRSRLIRASRDPWELLIAPPWVPLDPRKGTIAYSMWETTKLPPGSAERLNRAGGVVVPSHWCAEVFRGNGVVAPLYVIPPGVDREYFPAGPPPTDVCVFGTAGRLAHGGPRKGIEAVIAAFRIAFPTEPDARLTVKIWPDCPVPAPDDPRVTLVRTPLTTEGLARWYRGLTVYVSASCGEGFGMHPLQAMSCGRAVIATTFSGHSEYFDETVGYPLRYQCVPAGDSFAGLGEWGQPEPDHLAERMREVYAARFDAARLGAAAATRARSFTWQRAGDALLTVLRDLGALDPDVCSSPA
jgi:glycosyltransferase involved in cell wall biosynthesis